MTAQDWKLAKPQLEEDIEEIKWVKLDDAFMHDLHTYPAIREVLKELLSRKEDIF